MKALEQEVRAIVKDGLLWGTCKSAWLPFDLACNFSLPWTALLNVHLHCADQLLSHADSCCAAKLVPVGFGIRKMQITAVIEDAKVESMDTIIEEELVRDGESENIQSIDVVSFNKL